MAADAAGGPVTPALSQSLENLLPIVNAYKAAADAFEAGWSAEYFQGDDGFVNLISVSCAAMHGYVM